jgi:hypothetical protein
MKKIAVSDEDKKAFIEKYEPSLMKNVEKWGIEDAWHELLNSSDVFGLKGISAIPDDGPGYIGVVLADIKSDDSYLESSEQSIDDAVNAVKGLQELFKIKESPKIITGTRSC